MPLRAFRLLLLAVCLGLASTTVHAQFVAPDDELEADNLARKYKEDGVVCRSSHHVFTFDKGRNALEDKVVTVQEEAELDFLSIKQFAALTYPEYYNKFIQIKNFKKSVKIGSRYITSDRGGIDRSVTDDNVFFDDSRVQYFPLRFTQKGMAARINVKKIYADGKYLTRLFFRNPYPTLEQTFEFRVPEWLSIDFKSFNFEGNGIEKQQTTKGGYTIYTFVMRDIPAYKNEFKQLGRAYTDPHLVIQIKSFEAKGETLQGFDKVADVYRWNNRLYGMAGNDKEAIREAVNKLTAGRTTDIEKIKAIYYFVQDRIRYIAYEEGYSGYIPASAQSVLSNKYGDCKGMANLLTEMLRMAGYDAHFTWIGTREIPYPQSLPALCVNNHAITTLYYGGKEYFLDATEKYVPFGENAYRIQGKEALIANGEKFDIKKVPMTTGSDHKVFTKAAFILDGEQLTGNVQVTLTGNERKDFHQVYQDLPISGRAKFLSSFLEFNNDNLEASHIVTSDLANRELPVTISGTIGLANHVQSIAGSKYVRLDFFPKTLQGYMPDEKRITGYDLDYLLSYEDEFSLTIGAGSRFADVPEKLDLSTDSYEFHGQYIVNGSTITLKKSLVLKKSVIDKKDFDSWTQFLRSIKEFNSYFFSVTTK